MLAQNARETRAAVAAGLREGPAGGCTRQTPRCADARSYQVDLRDCCRGHIRQIVADAAEAMTAAGLTWWMDYGTLLGAVRNPLLGLEPGIIPHDKDADAGFLWAEWGQMMAVRAKLERQGYFIRANIHAGKLKVRLSAVNHTNLDLFAWREGNAMLYRARYIPVDNFKGRDFEKAKAFPLVTLPWEGLELPAPKDPAAFCAFRYGPSWQTPIRANHDGVRR